MIYFRFGKESWHQFKDDVNNIHSIEKLMLQLNDSL